MLHVSMSFLSPKATCLMVNRLFPCVRRISQDLAKDLAILAREIHDVAGEIDSVSSSGTAPSTTVSTAATTPGSAIDTREEVGSARPTQPDIQDSMKKVPVFLLLLLPFRLCLHCHSSCVASIKTPASLLLCIFHLFERYSFMSLPSAALSFLYLLILTFAMRRFTDFTCLNNLAAYIHMLHSRKLGC